MALMSKILLPSPFLFPRNGFRENVGAIAPAKFEELVCASVPNHAEHMPLESRLRSPLKNNRIGWPLEKVVMPDICHPLTTARVNLLSYLPRKGSGKL